MDTRYHCPLVGKEIPDYTCFEYCQTVEGFILMENIKDYKGTREEAEKICFNCENYKD